MAGRLHGEAEGMRIRTVIAGVSAAAVCLVVLYFQYYIIGPARFVPGWSDGSPFAAFPAWTPAIALVFCVITLFAFGWVAARWNWTDTWQSAMQSGAGMGVLAGCLIYDFIGAFWFSLRGNAEILQNAYNTLTETEGTRMLIESLLQTGMLLYLNFILVIFICSLLGGLGGLASALIDKKDIWGTDPRNPEGWLFRLPAYLLTIYGYFNIIVVVGILNPLWEKLIDSAVKLEATADVQWTLESPAAFMVLFGYSAALVFVFFPAGITWGWIIRSWFERRKAGFWAAVWIFLTTLGVAWVAIRTFWYGAIDFPLMLPVMASPFVAFVIGIIIGLITVNRSEGFGYRSADWFGFGITYAILGGTQLFMGVVAYSLSAALIGIVNIPHLINAEPVDPAPVQQVVYLHTLQQSTALGVILLSLVLGLVAAAIVSFLRTVTGVRDVAPSLE